MGTGYITIAVHPLTVIHILDTVCLHLPQPITAGLKTDASVLDNCRRCGNFCNLQRWGCEFQSVLFAWQVNSDWMSSRGWEMSRKCAAADGRLKQLPLFAVINKHWHIRVNLMPINPSTSFFKFINYKLLGLPLSWWNLWHVFTATNTSVLGTGSP